MSFDVNVFKTALDLATQEDVDDLAEILSLISNKLEELLHNGNKEDSNEA